MKSSTFVISEKKAPDILEWVTSGAIDLLAVANEFQVIPVAGGDGTMLYGIHELLNLELPFFGIDRGTRGFLLNPNIYTPEQLINSLKNTYNIRLPLLLAKFETKRGDSIEYFAFNDIYLNVSPGTVCYGFIQGDAYPRKEFSGDGIIVCTPQGSTAYNKAAGGSILPLRENLMGIRTICCSQSIRDGINSQKLIIEIQRGEMIAHADSQQINNVVKVEIKPAKIGVRIAFVQGYNFETKRYL